MESPPTVHFCDLQEEDDVPSCVCVCVFLIFTVKAAVVCQEVPAILRLSSPAHHPGAHGERTADTAARTTCK